MEEDFEASFWIKVGIKTTRVPTDYSELFVTVREKWLGTSKKKTAPVREKLEEDWCGRRQGGICRGEAGELPLTGSDLPSHSLRKGCRGIERGRGGKGEREGCGRPPALLPPPLASASNTTLAVVIRGGRQLREMDVKLATDQRLLRIYRPTSRLRRRRTVRWLWTVEVVRRLKTTSYENPCRTYIACLQSSPILTLKCG